LSHAKSKPIRYNKGMLRQEKRAEGMTWVFRWSEEVDGERHQHKDVIGLVKAFKTEKAITMEADRLRGKLNENKQQLSLRNMTFGELVIDYLNRELPNLSKSSQKNNKMYIRNWINPKWSGEIAADMKTMEIETWLHGLKRENGTELTDGTKAKLKGIMSTIFSHGVRWEKLEHNPVCGQGGTKGHRGASTGVRQSSAISIERVILEPIVVSQVLEELPLRETTMSLVDAVTALRASELIALQWKDVGWKEGILKSRQAWVEGELKITKSGDNPLPVAKPVLDVLRLWREHTPYCGEDDFIFASAFFHGEKPLNYQTLFRKHIQPVIERISGLESSKKAPIGWHTFRRSLATLLVSNGENVKVTQSQLKVVRMVVPKKLSAKLKAREAAGSK
jgi:integrase